MLIPDHLGRKLDDYVATLPVKTFVLRSEKRSGLIRARLLGAKHVTVSFICWNSFFFISSILYHILLYTSIAIAL